MLIDVTSVQPLEGHRLRLGFEDGVQGEVDLCEVISFSGVFAPLAERDFFLRVRVDPEVGTICWPNGADIDPDVLYALVSGEEIPALNQAAKIGKG